LSHHSIPRALPNFSSYLDRILDELFIDRMEGNEEIFVV
jgi:type I restriction enzyme R subunit